MTYRGGTRNRRKLDKKGGLKREYKNIEFLWKQRPGVGGMIALPPVASQIPGKYLCFLVTKATDRQHVNPESLVLALTRLRDFLVERGVRTLSLPVYDPNRGKLHPRELYALVHVIFSEVHIEVYFHKKKLSEHMLGIAFDDKWFLLNSLDRN